MQFAAAVSSAVAGLVAAPARPARLLGAGPAAIYLAVAARARPFIHSGRTDRFKTIAAATGMNEGSRSDRVLVLLAHDAARLPCGLVLPTTSAELPLTSIAPTPGAACRVGDGQLSWPGPDGPVIIAIVRQWPVARVSHGRPLPGAVVAARAVLTEADNAAPTVLVFRRWSDGKPAQCASEQLAGALLGRGPGLTPSGDDLLAGLLLGCLSFGVRAGSLRAGVAALAPAQTTALSAELLRHAARGECVPEAAAFAAALAGSGDPVAAARRLLGVGHTSGAALALGLILAAESATAAATRAAVTRPAVTRPAVTRPAVTRPAVARPAATGAR